MTDLTHVTPKAIEAAFGVDWLTDVYGGFYDGLVRLLLPLSGNADNADNTDNQVPDESQSVAPVYVTGLARAGTTITLEALAAHPHLASHRYGDYPFFLSRC